MLALIGGLAAVALALGAPVPKPNDFQAGQVWTYKTRPADPGSLVKIGAVEEWPAGKGQFIYHVSIIDIHLGPQQIKTVLGHAPISQGALEASVVELVQSESSFPDPTEGIAQWRAAKGGVFTIPLSDVVTYIDKMVSSQGR